MWCFSMQAHHSDAKYSPVVHSCAHGHIPDMQSELKRAVANTRRGKKATVEQQKEILRRVMALEAQNPTKDPASSPLLSGNWSLLYTGRDAWRLGQSQLCRVSPGWWIVHVWLQPRRSEV